MPIALIFTSQIHLTLSLKVCNLLDFEIDQVDTDANIVKTKIEIQKDFGSIIFNLSNLS